jgi:hypothetical protein
LLPPPLKAVFIALITDHLLLFFRFEIFEEEIPNGRRISLGGSIIVIDVGSK